MPSRACCRELGSSSRVPGSESRHRVVLLLSTLSFAVCRRNRRENAGAGVPGQQLFRMKLRIASTYVMRPDICS